MDQATQVFIGIGSNLQDPRRQVRQALGALQALAADSEVRSSSLYQTRPVGPQDQPDYINAVAVFYTDLTAIDLLHELQQIEKTQGRQRTDEQWGPRTIDLDLLLYGESVIETSELITPHPRIGERAFVLVPLHDLAPALVIPGLGSVNHLLDVVGTDGVSRINGVT